MSKKSTSEEQLEFLAKQAQELNMGYEMTEAQNKAEELIQKWKERGFSKYISSHYARDEVKGIIEELEIAMDNSEPPWTYYVGRIRELKEVLKHLEG